MRQSSQSVHFGQSKNVITVKIQHPELTQLTQHLEQKRKHTQKLHKDGCNVLIVMDKKKTRQENSQGRCVWFCWMIGPAKLTEMAQPGIGQQSFGGRWGQRCCCYWDARSGIHTSSLHFSSEDAGLLWVLPSKYLRSHGKSRDWIFKMDD